MSETALAENGSDPLLNRRQRQVRVFISYSRKDIEIADWLWDNLKSRGYEAALDRHDILPGEEWQNRLSGLIQSADAVVFCASPDFLTSQVCGWEIGEATRQGKRLLPVIIVETELSAVPQQLRRLNFIFMRHATERADALQTLAQAINTDIGWVRDHTRYGELAQRWSTGNNSRDLLIRGSALEAMQKWIKASSEDKPNVTDDVRRFLVESENEEARRLRVRKRIIALVSTLTLLTIMVGLAWRLQSLLIEALHWELVMKPSVPSLAREAELRSQSNQTFADCRNGCPQLAVVPAGTFKMGSTEARFLRERPQHQVVIGRPFAMAQHEVTFDEWGHCVTSGHCQGDISTNGWGRGNQPVINVTWGDANEYTGWLSKVTGRRYRLPSEAEWEYSARAGTSDYFSFGNDDNELPKYGWFAENSESHPHPVGTKLPNKFGLFDMHGNVSEWTADCANENYERAPSDGSAWTTGQCLTRVFRGGSWLHGQRVARSANRDWLLGEDRKDFIGFRVARDLE